MANTSFPQFRSEGQQPNILTLASERKNIGMVEPFLSSLSVCKSIEEGLWYNLLVAVTEAVNNAIIHGNKLNPNKQVTLSVAKNDDDLIITVLDEGLGFNPDSIRDPRDPENLLRDGGRGVFLIHSLAKSVEYMNTPSGALVVMRF
ncbi:MAG: ATP-binding protein [Ignavibacteriae bacterium]|nr:ATP-binding protein [Ignavibacteriota bacterium]